MLKDVWISISNRQSHGPAEEDTLVFDTAGSYFFNDGIGVLSYQESELTGLEGTRTSVMVMPNQVVVDRDGMLTGRMVFREGARDSFPYQTPYGQMMLGIDRRRCGDRLYHRSRAHRRREEQIPYIGQGDGEG